MSEQEIETTEPDEATTPDEDGVSDDEAAEAEDDDEAVGAVSHLRRLRRARQGHVRLTGREPRNARLPHLQGVRVRAARPGDRQRRSHAGCYGPATRDRAFGRGARRR